MTNYSRTTLRELKKRYLNVLKKCLLANLIAFSFMLPAGAETASEDRLANSGEKTYTQGVTFKDLDIVVSVGDSYGGAIFNADDAVLIFNDEALFKNNKAESETGNSYGGAIYNSGYMLLAGENTFGGYQTDENGDYVLDSEGNKISLGNEAKYGGAIYNTEGKKEGDVISYGMTLGKSTFMGNTALSHGGAISNSGRNSIIKFSGESAHFKGNLATSGPAPTYGGAISNSGNISFSTSRAVFEENASVTTSNNAHGGAIYNSGGSVVFEDTDSNEETPAVPNITYGMTFKGDTLFTSNKAEFETGNSYGGAIWNGVYMLLAGENTFGGYQTDENGDYVLDSEGNKISLGNQAKLGGAIYNIGGKKEGDVIAYGMTLGKSTFMGNTALSYGGAIYNTGYMNFTDEALFEGNEASDQGGAIYNKGIVELNSAEFIGNKSISEKGLSYGGAIYNFGGSVVFEDTDSNEETPAVPNITYGMTFKGDTLFTGNKTESETGNSYGGAIWNNSYMLLPGENTFGGYQTDENGEYVLDSEGKKISLGNEAKYGGAIFNTGGKKEGDVIAYGMTLGKSTFMGNTSLSTGGAVYNSGYMNFMDEALFEGNGSKAGAHSNGGAIYNNRGTITFDALARFEGNSAIATGGNAYGGAIRNEAANAVLGFKDEAQFKNNTATATGMEKADGTLAGGNTNGGAINNSGTITFDALATFDGNTSLATGAYSHGGAIINSGANAVLTFNDGTKFKNNTATATAMDKVDGTLVGGNAHGGAISNGGSITFGGLATFEGNTTSTTGGNAVGGAISNSGSITFDALATFEGNTSSATGGNAGGGVIYNYNNAIINFNNSFTFTNNKTISKGVETPNDISNHSTINFNHGLDKNGVALVGSLDGGISNYGTINKTGAGTLILGDAMVNSGTGTFNQSAGLTIAHSEKFLAGTNNILGGVLETHGAKIGYTANIGDETHTASLIHHSMATGNSAPTSLTTALKIGVSSTALFDSATNGIQANYELTEDMAGAGTVTFKDAHLTLSQTNYNGAYVMSENVTLNMQDGDTADSVSFTNLTGSANLKIDADIVNGENGLELVTDQIATNSDATLKLALTDVILSKNALDNGLSESYTATVMTGGTLTYGSEKGLVATDIYSYEVSGANNQITIDAMKFNEEEDSDVMKSVAEFDGDAAFNMTIGGDTYEMQSDVTMQANEKTIVGKGKETSTLTAKKITVDGAILNVENVSVSGENQLIDVTSGTLNVTNAKVDNIKNAGTTMLNTAEVSELENSGTLTANGSEIGELLNGNKAEVTGGKVTKVTNNGELTVTGATITELVNEKEATITGGELETATNKEKGMLSLSAGLRAGTVTNEGELTLDAVTVADLTNSATLKANGSTVQKLVNEQEAELTASTVEDLTNMGTMTAKDLTLKGALKGEGTATLSGKLVADDIFKSENKIISDGMEVSENIQKMELADLEVKDGTTLDVGTREVTAKEVSVGDKATLQVTLNNLDEHGTMKADKIEAGAGAGVHLVLGEKFEGGVFDVFKGTKGAGDLEVKHNNLYNVIEVEEGKYSFMTKDTEALQESLGATKEEVSVAEAMTQGTAGHKMFARMQSEMLIALQSLETDTVAKAKKALKAVGAKEQPVEQSVASEHLVALQNVVQAELHGTTVGHSGGEEDPRAKVYIKGLYDRTKSSMGEGFRARSKGAVLGVQSEVTEDLTLGVGYATSQTTAKEDLRRTEVDTNTGFISAHYQPNAWWVSGLATFSRGEYEEEKQILSSTGKASYNVDSWGAQVMTGYDIKLENAIITPEVGLRYLSVKQEGYTDTFGTTVSGTQSDYLTALVGVKGTWNMGAVRPTAGVTVGYDIISDDVSALNTLANGASYTVNGEALDRLSTTVTTGIEADLGDRTTLKLEYSGTYRKEYVDHSGMLKLEVRF